MPYRPIVATDERDSHPYPLDFQTAHKRGIPHRSVHIEITNDERKYFVWQRVDGRLEIPGGHVDWLQDQNRPESYEEAAMREIIEELNIIQNWDINFYAAYEEMQEQLSPITRLINQIPSFHGNNNEWVHVYNLDWQSKWGNPCSPEWKLSKEGVLPNWFTIDEIQRLSLEKPMGINASLRLFFQRRDILVPLIRHD